MLYPLSYEGGMTNGNATGVELARGGWRWPVGVLEGCGLGSCRQHLCCLMQGSLGHERREAAQNYFSESVWVGLVFTDLGQDEPVGHSFEVRGEGSRIE